jgi:hypothetical protein
VTSTWLRVGDFDWLSHRERNSQPVVEPVETTHNRKAHLSVSRSKINNQGNINQGMKILNALPLPCSLVTSIVPL